MDVSEAIRGRKSIRSYLSTPVEQEKIEKILEAGRLAPSASNYQDWKFIVVRDEETRKKLTRAAGGQTYVGQAPVVLVACATESKSIMMCGQPAHTVNVSIAFSFMLLQAYELGLGTCWIGAFREEEVKKVLDVPDYARVVAMSPLGYADRVPLPRSRKSMEEVACFETFEE